MKLDRGSKIGLLDGGEYEVENVANIEGSEVYKFKGVSGWHKADDTLVEKMKEWDGDRGMKLYRTRTQEEYDYLMQKLEDEGYEWNGVGKPTLYNHWKSYEEETVIHAKENKNILFGIVDDLDELSKPKIIEVSDLMEQKPDSEVIAHIIENDPLVQKIQERNFVPTKITIHDTWVSDEAVNHPPHYQGNKFEVIDIIEDYELDFHEGNVLKYLLRSKKKGDQVENYKKAIWYLERLVRNA